MINAINKKNLASNDNLDKTRSYKDIYKYADEFYKIKLKKGALEDLKKNAEKK